MNESTKLRVLIVDPDIEACSTAKHIHTLRPHWEITVSKTGHETIRRCRTAPPDVVVSEIELADMDGLEVIYQLRRLKSTVPFVILSAIADEGFRNDARHHTQFVLSKPESIEVIVDTIERAAHTPIPLEP